MCAWVVAVTGTRGAALIRSPLLDGVVWCCVVCQVPLGAVEDLKAAGFAAPAADVRAGGVAVVVSHCWLLGSQLRAYLLLLVVLLAVAQLLHQAM